MHVHSIYLYLQSIFLFTALVDFIFKIFFLILLIFNFYHFSVGSYLLARPDLKLGSALLAFKQCWVESLNTMLLLSRELLVKFQGIFQMKDGGGYKRGGLKARSLARNLFIQEIEIIRTGNNMYSAIMVVFRCLYKGNIELIIEDLQSLYQGVAFF